MQAALTVKRTFLEYDMKPFNTMSCRERAFSEGALQDDLHYRRHGSLDSLIVNKDYTCDASTETGSTCSTDDGMSCDGLEGPIFTQATSQHCDVAHPHSPPGQWQHSQLLPVTWMLMPVASAKAPTQGVYPLRATNAAPSVGHKRKARVQHAKSQKVAVRTTIIIRNLPKDISFDALLAMLDSAGFHGSYDFSYVPRNFRTSAGLGYAIVNFVTSEIAEKAVAHFSEHAASFSDSHQGGLMMLIQRFRNSPMMHPDVSNEYKPAVFVGGARVAFPPPDSATPTAESERVTKLLCGRIE